MALEETSRVVEVRCKLREGVKITAWCRVGRSIKSTDHILEEHARFNSTHNISSPVSKLDLRRQSRLSFTAINKPPPSRSALSRLKIV